MSVLRRRMVVAMRVRHFSERTEESYLHAIEQLYAFHHRMPDRLSRDDVVAFLEHCVSVRKLQRSTVNVYFQACRFLYEKVLERDRIEFRLPRRSRPRTRPQILSPEECHQIINAPRNLKHKALLQIIWSSPCRTPSTP